MKTFIASLRGPGAYLAKTERSRVVVHTKAGSSIEGVLTRVYTDCLVLEHAFVLTPDGRTAVDGEEIILHPNVDWIQRLGEAS